MIDLFPFADAIILEIEKAYSNSPSDPGGETKWAIARNRHPEITDVQWASFTAADAAALRRSAYWDAHRCGEMPWHWALGVFDGAVNQGGVVVRLAQQALGTTMDGVVGDQTLGDMRRAMLSLFDEYMALRCIAYTRDADFPHNGKGWLARVVRVARAASQQPKGTDS